METKEDKYGLSAFASKINGVASIASFLGGDVKDIISKMKADLTPEQKIDVEKKLKEQGLSDSEIDIKLKEVNSLLSGLKETIKQANK